MVPSLTETLFAFGVGESMVGRTRYPTLTKREIGALRPQVVLLPDEPYPFSAEDLPEFYALDIPAARKDR